MPRISSESVWEKSFNTEGTKATEFTEKRFRGRGAGTLLMVALLADGERNGKAVLFWRKRAGGERGVGAGGIFEAIEIEEEFSGMVEPVIGEAGVEEAAGGGGLGGLDDVEIQRADGHARIIFVAVGIDVQGLRLRRLAIDEKPLREAARGRVQRHFVAVEVEHAEVGGSAGGHVNFVVGGGPEGVIAEVEPLKTCQGEPTVRFLELGGGMLAPSGDFALPPRALRQSPGRDEEGR